MRRSGSGRAVCRRVLSVVCLVLLLHVNRWRGEVWAAVPQAPRGPAAEEADTMARMNAQRDQVVQEIRAAGFRCTIEPPKIVVDDVPSFGQYNEENNSLRTADWALLRPDEKGFLAKLAGPHASDAEVRAIFELAAHQWIFVHEMGHWWQACQGASRHLQPYAVEYGANRIALAYWRAKDPHVVTVMMGLFHQVLDHAPSPVPAGTPVETFFNQNYQTLGPSPMYPWFQSRMCVSLDEETPVPSLKQVLAETK